MYILAHVQMLCYLLTYATLLAIVFSYDGVEIKSSLHMINLSSHSHHVRVMCSGVDLQCFSTNMKIIFSI